MSSFESCLQGFKKSIGGKTFVVKTVASIKFLFEEDVVKLKLKKVISETGTGWVVEVAVDGIQYDTYEFVKKDLVVTELMYSVYQKQIDSLLAQFGN